MEISKTVLCKFCQALGGTGTCQENGHKATDHLELHNYHLRLISKSSSNSISAVKLPNPICASNKKHLEQSKKKWTVVGRTTDLVVRLKCLDNPMVLENSIAKIGSINSRLRALVVKRVQNGRLMCAECSSNLTVTKASRRNGLDISLVVQHVRSHLRKFIFECRHCDRRTFTKVAIVSHIFKKHSLKTSVGHFTDLTVDYRDEIIETAERCFGQPAKQRTDLVSAKIELKIRSRAGVNQLYATRQLHCHYLVKKAGNSKSLNCQLCSKNVLDGRTKGVSTVLCRHIEANHLKKPLYRCRRCSETINVSYLIHHHMKKEHGSSKSIGEFEDLSNDYHQEIMTLLSRCFDQGEKGSSIAASSSKE